MYHFDNILTDGCQLYFADMGLAACSLFDLSPEEVAFFAQHKLYDTFYTRAALAGEIAQRLTPSREEFKRMIKEYGEGKQDMIMSPTVTAMLTKYAQYTLMHDTFFRTLRKVSKSTPYPAQAIKALCLKSASKRKE